MNECGVPVNKHVLRPSELAPVPWAMGGANGERPRLQPYQETVSFLAHPQSLPSHRMLVCHRTGAGKTATMIQIADNFFRDRRPKILLFPTQAVAKNFYRELRSPRFPNRFNSFAERWERILRVVGKPDMGTKRMLELPHILKRGVVRADFLADASLPAAPLRAFTYTVAGGRSRMPSSSALTATAARTTPA
jgi:hypothetical protein